MGVGVEVPGQLLLLLPCPFLPTCPTLWWDFVMDSVLHITTSAYLFVVVHQVVICVEIYFGHCLLGTLIDWLM